MWPHCGHGTTPEDPIGCRGIHVPSHTECLTHLTDADRDAYLAGLAPGTSIDHRGTSLDEPLLDALLNALHDPATGHSRFGEARFDSVIFEGDAWFDSAIFEGRARFDSATFSGRAWFESAAFEGGAWFNFAAFEGDASFRSATFESAIAWFESATFQRDAIFESVTFEAETRFESATVEGDIRFGRATFERSAVLGPLACAGWVWLSGAVFSGPITLSFAARHLVCWRTRWSSTAALHLRYATVHFAYAVFEYPLTMAAEGRPVHVRRRTAHARTSF
ncbi:pentapeptide repeat-containing protein [Streptomyces sp. NPDC096068]|uniref:pentapeptide repeat-containing protein n=1 Tax=Streptomyces sp. NPDC096068 TaxID=3155424 RepID=UPI0033277979